MVTVSAILFNDDITLRVDKNFSYNITEFKRYSKNDEALIIKSKL